MFRLEPRFPVAYRGFSRCRSKHHLAGDKYQFLQHSVIPSYHFQKSLRRLPIPKLSDTCNRFLASAKVVLDDNVYKHTEEAVRAFERKDGPGLQKALIDYDRNHRDTSYISEPWFDMYLRSRLPCPVNFNPFMMYAPDPNPKFNHQLSRATNFAISFARFKRALDANILAPEVFHLNPKKSDTKLFRTVCKALPASLSWFGAVAFKAFPLDMSQYKSLFNGTRIPKKEKDVLYQKPNQKHFMVLCRGRIYVVDIFDENGNILPAESVHNSLAHILRTSSQQESSKCVVSRVALAASRNLHIPMHVDVHRAALITQVAFLLPSDAINTHVSRKKSGCSLVSQNLEQDVEVSSASLTSLDRDTWASVREELLEAGNGQNLEQIDGALFALCLDDLKSKEPARLVQSLLIGDDASNRWFDKCFQLIVDGNGQATINFEHSWGDGVAVLRLMEESFKDTNTHHFVTPDCEPESADPTLVKEIEFRLTDSLKSRIDKAQLTHISRNDGLDFSTMEYSDMTRETIKKSKVSPDSIMQLAIQMAFYALYREMVPTYESCSTAAFLKGRTDCMRSATNATKETVLAIHEGKIKDAKQLIVKCSHVHGQLVKEASMGQAFDRHLLGLKITAERIGAPIPALFEDPGFVRMGHFVLSTSTLSTNTIVFGGFGPVVEDGFGIGYNVSSSGLGAVISSRKKHRNAMDFSQALSKSLGILREILHKS